MNENLNNLERELKIMLTKEQYDQIRSDISFDRCYRQTNTYYDTPDQKLKQMGGAFRIRQLPGHSVITLKLPSDAITKQEYEYPTQATSPETSAKKNCSCSRIRQVFSLLCSRQPHLRHCAVRRNWNMQNSVWTRPILVRLPTMNWNMNIQMITTAFRFLIRFSANMA